MKLSMLIEDKLRKELFSKKAMARLENLGDLHLIENGRDIESLISGSEIVITSWGSPRMDEKLLDLCPSLGLMVHAAGSVKPVVSDTLYDRGVRVSSCACVLSRGVSEMAIGLTIAAAKNVFAFNDMIHRGCWPEDKCSANELFDITIGVVGCGFAGSHYIELKIMVLRSLHMIQGLAVNILSRLEPEKLNLGICSETATSFLCMLRPFRQLTIWSMKRLLQ